MKPFSLVLVALGALLLVLSVAWGALFPATRAWTNDKAERMNELTMQAHRLGGQLDAARRRPSMHGPSAAELHAENERVKSELAALTLEFNSVRNAPARASQALRWAGIALALIGGAASFATGKKD